jgi:predicted dehydrogenase/threonine dehydrogenase-like Zn-dependent dehydrogenase
MPTAAIITCAKFTRYNGGVKQLLQNLRNGETRVVEVPIPTPQSGEALVHTAASLVSAGTERMLVEFAEKSLAGKARSRPDLVRQVLDKARREGLLSTIEATFNRLDQPIPLGYSSAGTIVKLGPGLQGFQVGQRVACAGGNYAVHAEYACVPKNLLARIPAGVDFEAAAFTTLGAIALHGFRQTGAQLGERVAIIGLGLLGLLSVGIVRAAGCQVLGIDLDARRVVLAQQMGATAVLREQAEDSAASFSQGRGCDAILICADTHSSDPVKLAGAIARDRARVVAVGAVGLQIPRKIYYEKELTFLNSRSYGPGRYDPAYEEGGQDYPIGFVRWSEGRNLEAVLELMAAGQLDVHPLISHRFPIERAPEAYQLITGKQREPFLGVLLTYPEQEVALPADALPAGALLADALLAGVPPESEAPPTSAPVAAPAQAVDRVQLGVLGAGNFASAVMLPALSKVAGLDLIGIASASGANAQHAAKRFGFRYACSDEQRILYDEQINTVAILTRHNLHARQVVAALAAGKHVFCEKPLALTPEELETIRAQISAVEGGQAPWLMVGFNRRFAPLAQRLQAFFSERSEPLAAHYRVNAGFIPLTHWLHDPLQGGGRLIGEACHFVDFLTFLVGAAPMAVSAQALPDGGRYREDNAVLSFTFADGSLGMVSYLANGDKSFPKERVEVFAGGRVGVLDDFRSLELAQDGRRQRITARLRQDKGHLPEWQAFTAALQAGGPPPIPYAHLWGVTQATFCAVQALRSGQRVEIEMAKGHY